MEVETLDQLKSAFGSWRKQKQTRGESIPPELLERAKAATVRFGVNAVRRALNIDRRLIEEKPVVKRGRGRPRLVEQEPANKGNRAKAVPSYSRLEVSAPVAKSPHPIAEFETAGGSKLRVFSMSPETLGLLTSLCSSGGAR